MNKLIVVGGMSGAGKSYLLEQLAFGAPDIIPLRKLTTRKSRPHETTGDIDLDYSMPKSKVRKCDYFYNYSGEVYGINRSDIDNILSEGYSPMIIVRDSKTVADLREDYSNSLFIYVKSAFTGSDLEDVLRKQGRTDIEIEDRMDRQLKDLLDYTSNFHLYDHVFSNLYDDDSLVKQFDQAIKLERQRNPLERGLAFVLMSFSDDMEPAYTEMEDAAKLVSKKIRVHRIDKQLGDYAITPEILALIDRADLIVCDLTEEKPNVYYELGYARAKEKKVIHCAEKGTKLHFDIKDNRTIFYKNLSELRRLLVAEFKDHLVDS